MIESPLQAASCRAVLTCAGGHGRVGGAVARVVGLVALVGHGGRAGVVGSRHGAAQGVQRVVVEHVGVAGDVRGQLRRMRGVGGVRLPLLQAAAVHRGHPAAIDHCAVRDNNKQRQW